MIATKSYTRELNNVSRKIIPKPKVKNALIISKDMLLSKEFIKLSTAAKVTYIGLLTQWKRNSVKPEYEYKVKISYKALQDITDLSKTTLWRALKVLSKGNVEQRFINDINNHYLYGTNEYELNSKWLKGVI